MGRFSTKEYLSLKMPTEEVAVSDQRRIELALKALGYEQVTFPAKVLRKLYPLCRDAGCGSKSLPTRLLLWGTHGWRPKAVPEGTETTILFWDIQREATSLWHTTVFSITTSC